MKKQSFFIPILGVYMLLNSCVKKNNVKNPQLVNENEVITTVILELRDSSDTNQLIRLTSTDLNPGDNIPPTFVIPELEDNKTYYGDIILLDESKTITDTISNAILEEKEDHQFIFQTNNTAFSVEYLNTDIDANGYYLGINPVIKTRNISGQLINLQISLYHLPGIKKASFDENIKNGSADIETIFTGIKVK